jgi:hypothetical protein
MNDLEDRLRTALRAQAEEFTAGPDAWRRTTDRAGARADARAGARAGARRRLFPFASGISGSGGRARTGRLAPLAAAAAVVALAVATAAVAGTGGWHDLVSSRPAATPEDGPPTPRGQGGPGSRGREAIEQTCDSPVSAVMSFAGMSVWISRSRSTRAGLTGLRLCDSHGRSSAPGMAGSGPAVLPHGSLAQPRGVDPGLGLWGSASTSVVSVTADLANGRKIAGQLLLGHGFPVALWEVNYPLNDSAVIVFRNAAGHVVTTLNQPVTPPVNPLLNPTALPPADAGPCVGNGWNSALARAPQTVDGHQTWTYVQFGRAPGGSGANTLSLCATAGLLNGSTGYSTTLPGLAAGQLAAGELDLGPTSSAMGIAAPAVTSVTAVLADGKTYTGVFVHGRGFPYQVWLVSYPTTEAATLLFRDVAGQVVSTLHAAANGLPVP